MSSALGHFLRSAGKFPDRPALEAGSEVLSYASLKDWAERIATTISGYDNAGSAYVGIYADKSLFSYAAILGIMMTGKGYVPLNPKFPRQRNEEILKRSRTGILLSSSKDHVGPFGHMCSIIGKEDIADHSSKPEINTIHPGSPAYLLFTSGSTGKPKGVPVSQGNLAAYLDHMIHSYSFDPDDRFSQVFDLTFDLSVHDLFLSLAVGACLVIPGEDSPFALYHYIRKKELTVWFSVPTAARLMDRMRLLKDDVFPSLRYSFFCGEPLGVTEAGKWDLAARNSRLINLYGPTEATIAISSYEYEPIESSRSLNSIVSIGKIFTGQDYKISGEKEEGQKGELWLGGSQVVEGYFEDTENTRKSFISRGKGAGHWYRTGDLVSRDDEGYLYFLGRVDQEVKVHGYRVNLLEIEEVVNQATGSKGAVVHSKKDGNDRLVAFVEGPGDVSELKILDQCRETLPWYMVPEKVIFVKSIPLNRNGKMDRNKLKEMI